MPVSLCIIHLCSLSYSSPAAGFPTTRHRSFQQGEGAAESIGRVTRTQGAAPRTASNASHRRERRLAAGGHRLRNFCFSRHSVRDTRPPSP